IIADHNRIQARVREKLAGQTKILVNGNPVNRFSTPDNRECLDFLRDLLEELDLSADFSLMIDASAGDLWTGESYRLALTDGSSKNSDEFRSYWEEIIRDYQLGFLEDPFQEQDFDRWAGLTRNPDNCRIIGDNLYSSDSGRIREGAERKYTDGTLIKPNQAGTVSAVTAALKAARESGQIAITSHRSISTESTFLSWLTFRHRVEYIKIGPLQSDYSSVIRFNEIIRLTEVRDVD
ncbi:MAG: hypothetical protein JXB45_03710, partial [Candidatus Krumholzibacteriota bacterium]|nr:hypothetical protein [Candidatus Krumholzibacteriota bacterium]